MVHLPRRCAKSDSATSKPQVEWAACVIDHGTIDEINILQATMRAMEGAVVKLPKGYDRCLARRAEAAAGTFSLVLTHWRGRGNA